MQQTPTLKAALADVTTAPIDPTDPTAADPVAELVTLVDQLQNAAPAEVMPIATAIVAAAIQLGGEPAEDDDDMLVEQPDADVESKAVALRMRLKPGRSY